MDSTYERRLVELQKEIPFYHIKLSKFFLVHTMKAYWGMEIRLHTFLTSELTHVSFWSHTWAVLSLGKMFCYSLKRRLGGAAVDQFILEKRKVLGCLA